MSSPDLVHTLNSTKERPFRLEARSEDQTWKFVLDIDETQVDRYQALVDAIHRKSAGDVVFRIVANPTNPA